MHAGTRRTILGDELGSIGVTVYSILAGVATFIYPRKAPIVGVFKLRIPTLIREWGFIFPSYSVGNSNVNIG